MPIDNETWVRLWLGMLAGSDGETNEFMRAAARLVAPVYASRVPNREDLKDLLQTFLLKLWDNDQHVMRLYEPRRGSIPTYLRTVAIRHWLDWLKSRERIQDGKTGPLVWEILGQAGQTADQRLRVREIWAAVAEMPRKNDRDCMTLRLLGCKDRQISTILGLAMGTVATCLRRARQFLRDRDFLEDT